MKRSTSSIVWTVLLVIVLLLIGGVVAGEFIARNAVTNQVKQQFYAQQPAIAGGEQAPEPTVELSNTPLLWSLVTKELPHLAITTPETLAITYPDGEDGLPQIAGLPASQVTIDDLDLHNMNDPVAGHITVTTAVPDSMLLAQAKQEMEAQYRQAGDGLAGKLLRKVVRVTDVDGNPQTETLDIVFTDGAATLGLRPVVAQGQLTFVADKARLLGFDIPAQITDALTETMAQQAAGFSVDGLRFQAVDVTDDAMQLTLEGSNIPLRSINAEL
ncbi:LmeA family phospholipid-binding protein [Corynebacterium choanae]|uniref:DUF2993 domain-containing protein n=1 Tax=Corynebacterium choanae TaxID=1862358 RepID=A0A3G6J8Q8_9CORY|nr:LmeA family phospholipid-binding protein [Corynebacterium choanae]AZA14501.1 hypothetical protein CCHOA_10610 [Corynebacterium choanae]